MNFYDSNLYFRSRFAFDLKRSRTWKVLCKYYFQKFIDPQDSVVDLGAGWCDFINNVKAREKFAVDLWPEILKEAKIDVKAIVSDVTSYPTIQTSSINVVFASNVFEHLHRDQMDYAVEEIKRVLTESGKVIILQPNYRLSYKRYFDDYTHLTIWTDVSLCDYLRSKGFNIVVVKKRFLPFSLKSRFPVSEVLIRLYLKSPIKPFAGQMLIIASI